MENIYIFYLLIWNYYVYITESKIVFLLRSKTVMLFLEYTVIGDSIRIPNVEGSFNQFNATVIVKSGT